MKQVKVRLSKEEKINHLKVITELKLDILTNGKIRPTDTSDGYGFYDTCAEDLHRTEAFEKVMRAWGGSWHIAMDPIEEQLRCLTKVEQKIIETL